MYKALIVDDEKMIRLGIQKVIRWEEIGISEAFAAGSGKEALQIIRQQQPEIMITDINMTEMTGLELIREIRSDNPGMRIIVLTGYGRFDYARECLQMTVHDFLLKPVDEADLTRAIQDQVRILQEQEQARQEEDRLRRTEGSRQQIILEEIMQKVIHKTHAASEIGELCRMFHYDADQRMQLAVLVPELYMDEDRHKDKFRTLTIQNICMGLLDAQGSGITFADEEARIILVFFAGDAYGDITERIGQINTILEDEYGMKPQMVLGSEVQGFARLHVSYNDVCYLLTHETRGLKASSEQTGNGAARVCSRDIYQEFRNNMAEHIADRDFVLHVFDSFKKATVSYNLSKPQVRRCCFELACDVFYAYVMETGNSVEERLESLLRSLAGTDREAACEVTGMFLDRLLQKDEEQVHEIIVKVKRYIDEHLDGDLSVMSIAADHYVSPNYFSRLFKRTMGEGCNEYVVRKRIEKARFLLETTNIKAGKIAAMVGYHDTNYFSLAFKKHTGIAPTKYREHTRESG